MKLVNPSFNNLLRRDIEVSLKALDMPGYRHSLLCFEEFLEEALGQRPEIEVSALNTNHEREEVKIAKSGSFPAMDLTASYDYLLKNSRSPERSKTES